MCGIVGYIGERDVVPILLDGLNRLEYRGYDSAGVAILKDGELKIKKAEGRLSNLVEKIELDANFKDSYVGIGHTRWATHGKPTERNSHPHTDAKGEIAVVHNGIIENYSILKDKLIKEGHEFKSDTDTEVLAHLIGKFYNNNSDNNSNNKLEDAVRCALQEVRGAYAIGVISTKEPDKIVAARFGSPLIIGKGKDGNFIASDVPAILPYTSEVFYPGECEIAVLTKDHIHFKCIKEFKTLEKRLEKIDWDAGSVDKGGFPHFMLKEIYEQPGVMRNTLYRLVESEGTAKLGGIYALEDYFNKRSKTLLNLNKIIIVACGTSWHAGLVGEYVIENLARIPVEVEYASEFQYRNPTIDEDTLIILISQSGETADTITSMNEAKSRGGNVFGICNVVGSTIYRETAAGIWTIAGPEIGVASTKAFTSQLFALYLIALYLGRIQGNLSVGNGVRMVRALKEIPDNIEKILNNCEKDIITIAEKFHKSNNFIYLGRHVNFPVALEGALKLKEISYCHAEGYPSGEMKHGPIALIDKDMPVVVIVPKDNLYEKVMSNISEIKARGGKVIAIATEGDTEISKKADHVIYIPETEDILTPLLTVIPLQLLAYHIAVMRGCDVDKPRNLAKSVTVE